MYTCKNNYYENLTGRGRLKEDMSCSKYIPTIITSIIKTNFLQYFI